MDRLERSLKKLNKHFTGKDKVFAISTTPKKKLTFDKTENSFLASNGCNHSSAVLEERDESSCSKTVSESTMASASSVASNFSNVRQPSLLGLSSILQQMRRKMCEKVFNFTIMVVGQSGLGKSTLINSMFHTNIYSSEYPGPSKRNVGQTVSVESHTIMLKENGITMSLTVVDTPGFAASSCSKCDCWMPIVQYIDDQHCKYLNEEMAAQRGEIVDKRVHCCLYFIEPTGHSLKQSDIDAMKALGNKVNIIPVIAKSDCMTVEERTLFKEQLMADFASNNIQMYTFPEIDDDDELKAEYYQLKSRVPFAVASSNAVVEQDGRRFRVRQYPWGQVDIENLDHCDFKALRDLVIKYCLYDLVDITDTVHYANYREQIVSSGYTQRDKLLKGDTIGAPN